MALFLPGLMYAFADGTKVRSDDAAAVLASMREDSMKLAAAAASGSGELLSQSPVQSGAEIVAVGAPKLACQGPPLTLTQRWQVTAMDMSSVMQPLLMFAHVRGRSGYLMHLLSPAYIGLNIQLSYQMQAVCARCVLTRRN